MPQPLFLSLSGLDLPENVKNELNPLLASLQTWINKTEGVGRWIDSEVNSSMIRVDGTGNTWGLGLANTIGAIYRYTLIGDTAIVQVRLTNTALTITTAVNGLYVRLPGNLKMAKSTKAPLYITGGGIVGRCIHNGASIGLYVFGSTDNWIGLSLLSGANWITDNGLTFDLTFITDIVREE
jgi:hypothetical protein